MFAWGLPVSAGWQSPFTYTFHFRPELSVVLGFLAVTKRNSLAAAYIRVGRLLHQSNATIQRREFVILYRNWGWTCVDVQPPFFGRNMFYDFSDLPTDPLWWIEGRILYFLATGKFREVECLRDPVKTKLLTNEQLLEMLTYKRKQEIRLL